MNRETTTGNSARCLVEKPSIETRITFWDWEETSRPELRLLSDNEAVIDVGGSSVVELVGKDRGEIVNLLEGWRDIIQAGIDLLNAEAHRGFDEASCCKDSSDSRKQVNPNPPKIGERTNP